MNAQGKRNGLIAVRLEPPAQYDEEFNAWYNLEHIAQITALPGFVSGRRYRAQSTHPRYLALYETADETIDASPPFQQVIANPTPWSGRMRGLYGNNRQRRNYRLLSERGSEPEKDASWLLMVEMQVPSELEKDLNDWYEQEHIPGLTSVAGCYRARRFQALTGSPKYCTIYELAGPHVIESAEWAKARNTQWSDRLRPHFQPHLKRDLFELILPWRSRA